MDATIYLSTHLLIGTAGEVERNDLVMENTNALSNISVLKGKWSLEAVATVLLLSATLSRAVEGICVNIKQGKP